MVLFYAGTVITDLYNIIKCRVRIIKCRVRLRFAFFNRYQNAAFFPFRFNQAIPCIKNEIGKNGIDMFLVSLNKSLAQAIGRDAVFNIMPFELTFIF